MVGSIPMRFRHLLPDRMRHVLQLLLRGFTKRTLIIGMIEIRHKARDLFESELHRLVLQALGHLVNAATSPPR